MRWWYPTPDQFQIEYDDEGRAYLRLNGVRFGVQHVDVRADWEMPPGVYSSYQASRVRLEFDLVELYESPAPVKPKRSWAKSMGLRRPS